MRSSASAHETSASAWLDLLSQALPDVATFSLDPDGGITSWSAGARRLYGLSDHEVVGRPFAVLYADTALGQPSSDLAAARALQRVGRRAQRRRDGTAFDAHLTLRAVPRGFLVVARAASCVAGADAEAERHTSKLAALGRLTGAVAHDFNNLLTAIAGFSDLALHDIEARPREARASIQEIRRAGERAAALTRQLLASSRPRTDEGRHVDVNAVIGKLAAVIERLAGDDVSLVLRLGRSVGSARATATQLEQVVMNLAANAAQAMPRGGQLHIETRDVDLPDGSFVELTVADTGEGMDEQRKARIFEPFFTTKAAGTGLGLATVADVVNNCGGRVEVDSAPDRGTRFRVLLPRREGPAEPATTNAFREQATRGTLLLVDDEVALRRMMRRIAIINGYEVLDARDADEALQAARAHADAVDLVVCDLALAGDRQGGNRGGPARSHPNDHGPALVARLGEVCPQARVLFVSGAEEPPELGAPLLRKPFTPAAFVAQVRALLEPTATG